MYSPTLCKKNNSPFVVRIHKQDLVKSVSIWLAEFKKKKCNRLVHSLCLIEKKTPTTNTFLVYMSGWHNLPYCLPEQLHDKPNKPWSWPANHLQQTPNTNLSPIELPPHLSFFLNNHSTHRKPPIVRDTENLHCWGSHCPHKMS